MMLKLGWSQGKGLGKNEDGMATHIKVDKRSDKLGIGSEVDETGNLAFSKQIHGFNNVLALLQKVHGQDDESDGERKLSAKKRKRSEYEEDKKKSKKEKKKKKTREESVKAKKSLTVSRKANAKLVRAKDVSKFSQMDMKAILGHA